MKKPFDVSQPHTHYCPRCGAPIHCRAKDCEIPQSAECLTCREGAAVETVVTHRFLGLFGYRADGRRRTWPGRFAEESHRLPYRATRAQRKSR